MTGSAKTLSRPGPKQLGPHAELGFAGAGWPNPTTPPDDLNRGGLKDNGPEDTGGVKDSGAWAAGAGAEKDELELVVILDDDGLEKDVLPLDEGREERPPLDVLTVILPRCRPRPNRWRWADTATTATSNINTIEILMMVVLLAT